MTLSRNITNSLLQKIAPYSSVKMQYDVLGEELGRVLKNKGNKNLHA